MRPALGWTMRSANACTRRRCACSRTDLIVDEPETLELLKGAGPAGGMEATALAAARVERILAEHGVPLLDPLADAVIEAVVARAEAPARTA